MKTRTFQLCLSALMALTASRGAVADPVYLPLEQARRASVNAFAHWVTGGQSDASNLSLEAPDFESFDVEPTADAMTDNSRVEVLARHQSHLLPRRIIAGGSMAVDAFSECVGQGCSAGGAANSYFELSFEVGELVPFRLEGSLAAAAASASVEFLGPGGFLFERHLSDTAELIAAEGVLDPGIYSLQAKIQGDCTAEEIESCRSAGYFNAQLILETGVGAQSRSFSAIKSLYD